MRLKITTMRVIRFMTGESLRQHRTRHHFDLIVTDYDAEGKPMETTVKLASAQIDPVKGMKVTYVDDQYISPSTLTHPSNMNVEDDD